jgi:hypothetical protein
MNKYMPAGCYGGGKEAGQFLLEPFEIDGMLRRMRWIIPILLLAGTQRSEVAAQDAATATNSPPVIIEPAKSGLLSPDESNQYVRLKLDEARLEAQLKLVNDLADEHQKRSDTAKAEKLESERWETANAQEMRTKALALMKQLNEASRQRLAFEERHIAPIITILGPGSFEPAGSLNPFELAFVLRLEKRLSTVTGEWLAAMENSKNYTQQLGTNRVPEEMNQISSQLNDSTRQARELEKELSDLELRRLEFRALRK